ncbi:MAG: O-antigen ligase family protein [Myxococcota bacterium]
MTAAAEAPAGSTPLARLRRIAGPAGRTTALLWMLIVFLVLEYARPPLIVKLKLQMLISLALPLLCISMIKDKRWSWTLTCQLGIIGISALGVFYAYNYFAAYFTTRILFTTIALSISMAWLLARIDFFRKAMWAWTLIMAYVGFYGIQMGGFGPGGNIGDENEMALACVTAIPMAFFGVVHARGAQRWVYGGIGLVLVVAIVISKSRGGFVGLALTVAYIILISKHRIRALAGLAIAALVFVIAVPKTYLMEIVSIKQEATGEIEDGTADARFFLWTAAFNMWKAHPILGVGAGNSIYHTGRYQPDWEAPMYSERDWSGTAIHSGVFEALSELGSVGVFFYTAMFVHHFSTLRRVRRTARRAKGLSRRLRAEFEMYSGALAGGIIGYLGSGVFLSVAYHPYAFYFSALGVALSWSLDVELQKIAAKASTGAVRVEAREPEATRANPPPSRSLGSELLTRRT